MPGAAGRYLLIERRPHVDFGAARRLRHAAGKRCPRIPWPRCRPGAGYSTGNWSRAREGVETAFGLQMGQPVTSRAVEPISTSPRKPKKNGPIVDWAKECTDVSTPLRTTKVPKMDSANVTIGQRQGPHFEHPAPFLHHDRMEEGRGGEPRHTAPRSRPGPSPSSRPSRARGRPTRRPSAGRSPESSRRAASNRARPAASRVQLARQPARRWRRRTGRRSSYSPSAVRGGGSACPDP